jgi:hypothetical protein
VLNKNLPKNIFPLKGAAIMITKEIKNNLLNLNALEKVEAIELLSDSLDKPDAEVEAIIAKESERRYKEYKSGKLKARDLYSAIKALK